MSYWFMNNAFLKNTRHISYRFGLKWNHCSETLVAEDLRSICWNPQKHSHSQHLDAFMAPSSTTKLKFTAQIGCNSAANFLICVAPYSNEMCERFSWMENVNFRSRDENLFFLVFQPFLKLRAEHNLFISLLTSIHFSKDIRKGYCHTNTSRLVIKWTNYAGTCKATESVRTGEYFSTRILWFSLAIFISLDRTSQLYLSLQLFREKIRSSTEPVIRKQKLCNLAWTRFQWSNMVASRSSFKTSEIPLA